MLIWLDLKSKHNRTTRLLKIYGYNDYGYETKAFKAIDNLIYKINKLDYNNRHLSRFTLRKNTSLYKIEDHSL